MHDNRKLPVPLHCEKVQDPGVLRDIMRRDVNLGSGGGRSHDVTKGYPSGRRGIVAFVSSFVISSPALGR